MYLLNTNMVKVYPKADKLKDDCLQKGLQNIFLQAFISLICFIAQVINHSAVL